MATNAALNGIRGYLTSLATKPGRTSKTKLVDKEAVKALRQQVKDATDPIDKAKLLSALETERAGKEPQPEPDDEGAKAVFIAEAGKWAEEEGISVKALQTLKVPDDVLKAAGFKVAALSQRQGTSTRAPRMNLDDVAGAASKLGAQWRLSDLATKIDRDTATTRNYVNKLVEAGNVKIIGDDPKHEGRGRAPKIYSLK